MNHLSTGDLWLRNLQHDFRRPVLNNPQQFKSEFIVSGAVRKEERQEALRSPCRRGRTRIHNLVMALGRSTRGWHMASCSKRIIIDSRGRCRCQLYSISAGVCCDSIGGIRGKRVRSGCGHREGAAHVMHPEGGMIAQRLRGTASEAQVSSCTDLGMVPV